MAGLPPTFRGKPWPTREAEAHAMKMGREVYQKTRRAALNDEINAANAAAEYPDVKLLEDQRPLEAKQ